MTRFVAEEHATERTRDRHLGSATRSTVSEAVSAQSVLGHYARKQLRCRDPIIAFSHRRRFQCARRLIREFAGRSLLDYGCGDGTFLALTHDLFPLAVGADVDPQQTMDCARRFTGQSGIAFVMTEDLAQPSHAGAYGVVVCMEVLEHCIEERLEAVLRELRRLVASDGIVVISVPIEIGVSLVGKYAIRTVAGWRRLGDYEYRERYTFGELRRMILATSASMIVRPVYRADFAVDRPNLFHGHKGFNWRRLRDRPYPFCPGRRAHRRVYHPEPQPDRECPSKPVDDST